MSRSPRARSSSAIQRTRSGFGPLKRAGLKPRREEDRVCSADPESVTLQRSARHDWLDGQASCCRPRCGPPTFVTVGTSLPPIKGAKLYRKARQTLGTYCRDSGPSASGRVDPRAAIGYDESSWLDRIRFSQPFALGKGPRAKKQFRNHSNSCGPGSCASAGPRVCQGRTYGVCEHGWRASDPLNGLS